MSARQWLNQAIVCLCLLAVVIFGERTLAGLRQCHAAQTCPFEGAR